ncbi:hypothetical protein P9314_03995 [Paenibacillus validus]|uniref:phage tail assembly chaperone n=1 Tax=Paenibacillus validus TaxID=44253 RepID=UPI000FD9A3D9|nr:hypothetical protein [Paenibacillus validus]MED4599869.1 hypothetical protein [Paenibacillus validus]MED4606098.1 hypothetical protein [Paenibacillus validus]
MSKKLTIKDLLAQKDQLKQKKRRRQTLHIESLDAKIVIEEPSRALALEAIGMVQNDQGDVADAYVVYNCVVEPNLKDPQLQKEFGCAEPTDIVDLIFRAGEISAISGQALQLAGFGQGVKKVDEELKN